MEDFIGFNPADHVDFSGIKITELKSRNTWLTIGLITAVCVAGYYAYRYYQLNDYHFSDSGGVDVV